MISLKKLAVISSILTISSGLIACAPLSNQSSAEQENPQGKVSAHSKSIWQPINSVVAHDTELENKIQALLVTMTIEQKVAQMIQPEIRDITPDDMRQYGFGSYLNGGGSFPNNNKHASPQDWVALAEVMYQASIDDSLDGSTIPTMWGTDAVHGHNNVIGATLFPHNIGLGAANNPDLIEKIAQVTATEVMVTGIDWVFAPTVATVRDDRWGRTYEGYSEDPEIVKTYAQAIVKGLQGQPGKDFLADNRVISTVKHFVGDGGTVNGDDQGNNISSEQDLHDIHAQGYVSGLAAGSQSVMASFNSWHGEKIHGNQYLLTDVLKEKMGFDGFVVGDWNGHGQVKGCSNENCPQAINAGLDIFMVPTAAWKPLFENTVAQAKQGIIPLSRIDDAVTRILRVKFRAGLFDKPSPANRPFSAKTELIGASEHRQVARQAVRESLVLLKNKSVNNAPLLPLSPTMNILVAGDAADNIGKQSGGWTITWQGTNNQNDDFPGASSIYQGLAQQVKAAGGTIQLAPQGNFTDKPDVAIVVFGEEPYAEGQGDVEHLAYQLQTKQDLALLKKLQAQGIATVSVFITGRPMWVNAELNASDAFVVAWLPGSEGSAVADVLLSDKANNIQHDFKGKLSFSWPKTPTQIVNRYDADYQPLLPYGFGLTYAQQAGQHLTKPLADNLSEASNLAGGSDNVINVFAGKLTEQWQMALVNTPDVTSEKQVNIQSNSATLSGVSYRTTDKDVQEDAFSLSFTAANKARFQISSKTGQAVDLSSTQAGTSLVLMVKKESEIKDSLFLSMACQDTATVGINGVKPACSAKVDLQQTLAVVPINQWQEISIDLSCFTQQGLLTDKVLVPFELSAAGKAALSISGIQFKAKAATASLQCQ
ncbi:MAG: glycoside hydrolase family 3 N-terminal domain-containing protein [Thalassotalea sp.]